MSTATSAASAGAVVLVHVVGQVRRPGVVRLAPGARVEDAVAAAGGATGRADLAAVNLARPVVDGEQIVVPRPGEATPPAGPSGGASPSPGTSAAGPVDLNAATPEQLDALPGIGPVLAGRIVDFRTQHGRFGSVDELGDVSGIGDALLERLRPLVRV
ncbi:MAG: ComEA family DNA-binding protein [Angustibacter sp.]